MVIASTYFVKLRINKRLGSIVFMETTKSIYADRKRPSSATKSVGIGYLPGVFYFLRLRGARVRAC